MMEYPVIADGVVAGNCTLEERGLYWQINCVCKVRSDRVERVYCGDTPLGVLVPEGRNLVLRRKVSKTSMPMLPPASGVFTMEPAEVVVPWEGLLEEQLCRGFCAGDVLLFPYDKAEPCPCEPLFCFFEIRDGFWRLDTRCLPSSQNIKPAP